MSWPAHLRNLLLTTRLGRLALLGPRLGLALRHSADWRRLALAVRWAFTARDIAARGYRTTSLNQDELCWTVAMISGQPFARIAAYRDEIINDGKLAAHVAAAVAAAPERWSHDPDFHPGRRLACYLLIRALRPRRVIEAGTDRGFGAMLICRALARNGGEGQPGDYVGFDAKGAEAAFLYTHCPDRMGRIEQGDAARLLREQSGAGALVIHDTCTADDHMAAFCAALDAMMATDTVLVSSWLHPALMELARRRGLAFLSHQDSPQGHWTPGSRLSFVFPRPRQPEA